MRKAVKVWRDQDYTGATETSKALLSWWFETAHSVWNADGTVTGFRYYFAQREAVEAVVYLHEAAKVRQPTDLIPFDSSGVVVPSRFDETWLRLVLKMATGSGKTKVMCVLMAWSYFNRKYENDESLARNFLLIAPNIIVLDHLRTDFDGARIFLADPVLPENGFRNRNWIFNSAIRRGLLEKEGLLLVRI